MNVSPLSNRATAVRDALLSHGWEGDLARLATGGLDRATFHVTGLDPIVVETMVPLAARLGLEIVTGDGWLILTGGRSRFGAFARPWLQPEPVQELANAIGMAMPAEQEPRWQHARGSLPLDHAVMIGILNVTPDSFSDGGTVQSVDDALRRAETLLQDGAAIIDVGGESTRPGAMPVGSAVELERIMPVLTALVVRHPAALISVDTVHAATADAALGAGAAIVNDVTAGRHDVALLNVASRHGAGLVLSHSRGPLGELASYAHAEYEGDVVGGVIRELQQARFAAIAAGVSAECIALDPGFGFAKTGAQSLTVLDQLDAVVALGLPVMVGMSRKRFLGDATGRAVDDRDRATAAAAALAYDRGARLFRVHDPAAVRDALAVAEALGGAAH